MLGSAELPGGTFRVISDPTVAAYGDIVLAAWSDCREGAARIYYVRSVLTTQPWDPAVDAPWAHGDSHVTFIGDYMGLVEFLNDLNSGDIELVRRFRDEELAATSPWNSSRQSVRCARAHCL